MHLFFSRVILLFSLKRSIFVIYVLWEFCIFWVPQKNHACTSICNLQRDGLPLLNVSHSDHFSTPSYIQIVNYRWKVVVDLLHHVQEGSKSSYSQCVGMPSLFLSSWFEVLFTDFVLFTIIICNSHLLINGAHRAKMECPPGQEAEPLTISGRIRSGRGAISTRALWQGIFFWRKNVQFFF